MKHAKTIEALAQILGKSRSQLIIYGQRGAPCTRRDKSSAGYLVDPIKQWCEDRGYLGTMVVKANGHGGPVDDAGRTVRQQYLAARARERQARARIMQLKVKQRESELISVAEVREHRRRCHGYMSGVLEDWALRLGPALAGRSAVEIGRIMADAVNAVMRVFSGQDEELVFPRRPPAGCGRDGAESRRSTRQG